MRFTLGLLTLVVAMPVLAQRLPSSIEVSGDRIIVIDGDTIALPCGPRPCKSERVRIANIDAPETRNARCEGEAEKGLAAKAELARLIRGRSVTINRCEPETGRCTDYFERTLAHVVTAEGDVGAAMVATGHVLLWREGKKARDLRIRTWCP